MEEGNGEKGCRERKKLDVEMVRGGSPSPPPIRKMESLPFSFTVHFHLICSSTLLSIAWAVRLLLFVPIAVRENKRDIDDNLRAMRGIEDDPMSGARMFLRRQLRGVSLRYRS